MTFLEALEAARSGPTDLMRVHRPNGPAFTVDDLGQVTGLLDCAYLADFLEFDDWEVSTVPALSLT